MSEQELVSFRGLQDGAARTPLQDFWGVLDSCPMDIRQVRDKGTATYVTLNFSLDPNVDIIKSTEPYPYPIAQISMPLNKRRTSLWTILSDSATKLIGDNEDIGSLFGSKLHMRLTPHMLWDQGQGKEVPRDCFEVVEIIRVGATPGAIPSTTGTSPTDRALDLLEGCATEQDWNQRVFQDAMVKGDMELLTSIINKTFFPAMEESGRVIKDGSGMYRKVS